MSIEGTKVETAGWQGTLDQALDFLNSVGLHILVRLAPLIIGILLLFLAVWIIRRQVRNYKRRIASGAKKAFKDAVKLGAHAASGAANVAATAANQTTTAFQEYAVPTAKSVINAATPHVQAVTIVAARAGANQASDVVAKAMPVAKDLAGAAYGVSKTTVTALGILAQVKSSELLDKARAAQKKREES